MTREEKRIVFILGAVSAVVVLAVCVYGFIKHPFLSFAFNPIFALILDLF
jgi:hypothetical protein